MNNKLHTKQCKFTKSQTNLIPLRNVFQNKTNYRINFLKFQQNIYSTASTERLT